MKLEAKHRGIGAIVSAAATTDADDVSDSVSVSVIMPVLNGARYIDTAVASIIKQSYADFEFIIIDDGSTDNTPEYLRAWARRDARVRILAGSGGGISAALNKGLAEARGAIIVRMDADDIAAPERIRQQVSFLQANPTIAVVGSALRYVDADDSPSVLGKYPLSPGEVRTALRSGQNPIAHPTVAMRRDVVRAVGEYRALFDGAEDFDLWLRITEQHEIANLPEALLDYRLHDDKVSIKRRWEQALAALLAHHTAIARRSGLPDPTAGATRLELQHLLALDIPPKPRTAALIELAEAALQSFQANGRTEYLECSRECLLSLDTLSQERGRRAARTLIWYLWRTGARGDAMALARWMVQRRVPLAIWHPEAAHDPAPHVAGTKAVNRWLVRCADPHGSSLPPPSHELSPAQFQQLIDEAESHGVLPAVMRNLPEFVRADAYAAAGEDGLAKQRVGLTYATMLRHYGDAIRNAAAGLPATVVKGPTFARLLYPDLRLRPFTDIDLLVAPSAVPAVKAILKEQGFEFLAHDHDPQREEAKWVHRDSALLMVEVQTNLVHHPKMRDALSLAYEDIAEGPESPAAQMTIASFHGALHRFERLRQVVDICQAARNLKTSGDEAQLERMLERTGGRFAAVSGLDLAYRLFREPRCREIAKGLGSVRHRLLTRLLVDRAAVLSTMNSTRFHHSWRRQMYRLLLQRSHQF